ncbi:response regulator transcription factor [Marinospirillum sp.]|uniref:response regulator transcription factor n=1 Tax=Marinospirillum sp. TaxID=2183934 RepID=UPI003A875563
MPSTRPLRLVVVDDEPMMRELLKEFLTDIGHQVIAEGNTGYRAIELAKQHQPDLVFLDINMPELSGLDALASIKTLCENQLVIMVTACSTSSEVQQAIRTGADGYVLKPFRGQQISSAIDKALAKKAAMAHKPPAQ